MSIDPRVRIKMSDCTMRPICNVKAGDMVITGSGDVAKVVSVDKVMQEDESFEIMARGHGLLSVSSKHCVVTKRGCHMAKNLIPAELICDDNGGYGVMIVYRAIFDREDTEGYEIKLEGADTLVAEGFIIGDSTKKGIMYSTLLDEYEDPEEAFMISSDGAYAAMSEPDVSDIMAWVEPPKEESTGNKDNLNDIADRQVAGENVEDENERMKRYYRL